MPLFTSKLAQEGFYFKEQCSYVFNAKNTLVLMSTPRQGFCAYKMVLTKQKECPLHIDKRVSSRYDYELLMTRWLTGNLSFMQCSAVAMCSADCRTECPTTFLSLQKHRPRETKFSWKKTVEYAIRGPFLKDTLKKLSPLLRKWLLGPIHLNMSNRRTFG